jgi:hypothetical protein
MKEAEYFFMKLQIYVHDFHLEIGHTRATIDLLNHLSLEQKSVIEEIEVISFTASDPSKLLHFPEATKISFIKVPFPNLYPFIVKEIFYHAWTACHHFLHRKKNYVSLSIGIAFLFPDIVNIQFIHHHWDELNQLYISAHWYKKLYKKLLFSYFNLIENFVYKNKKTYFLVLSNFTKSYLMKKFQIDENRVSLTYSHVNQQGFFLIDKTKNEILNDLGTEAQCLKSIDFNKPVFLFVGAFERKGLARAIELLKNSTGAQLIVIGKPEFGGGKILKNDSLKIFHISFTKNINAYYNLSDYFLFPTMYEPFGLVILEAAVTGLSLLVPFNNVGASELLVDDEATVFIDKFNCDFSELKVLSTAEREKNIKSRKEKFMDFSWDKSAKIFYDNILMRYLTRP